MRVQTLALVWPLSLMRSQRLSPNLIGFEPAQIFVESRQEFCLVWAAFVLSRDELSSTLVFVWPLLSTCSHRELEKTLVQLSSFKLSATLGLVWPGLKDFS